jgi:hypothetical protein
MQSGGTAAGCEAAKVGRPTVATYDESNSKTIAVSTDDTGPEVESLNDKFQQLAGPPTGVTICP